MKNVLWKDIFRDINKSKGRFFSIISIIALGVMLFTGVKMAPVDMKTTADKYYDDYNLMDLRVVSNLGLTDEDLSEIKNINGVLGAYGEKSLDALMKTDSNEFVIRIQSLPKSLIDDNNEYINRLKVVSGHLPETDNQCVIGEDKFKKLNLKLGDKIKLESGRDTLIDDSLKYDEYEIVGIVEAPYYLSNQIGSSTIGNGTVSNFMFINKSNFKMKEYTDIFVTVNDAKALNSYNSKYFDVIDEVASSVEEISENAIDRRYDEVRDLAYNELNKGKEEYEKQKAGVDKKLNDATDEIQANKDKLASGEAELSSSEAELNNKIASGEAEISAAEAQLAEKESEYNEGLVAFNNAKVQAEEGFKSAESIISGAQSKINEVSKRKTEIENLLKDETLDKIEQDNLQVELAGINEVINQCDYTITTTTNSMNAAKQQLATKESELNNGKTQLDSAKATLSASRSALESAKTEGLAQIASAKAEIENGKKALAEGEEEYNKNKAKADEELKKAEEKLKDAEDKISKIEKPTWYVLDRKSHYSYVDYENSANSIDKLANVFPVFFLVVAALVCLTTMTRMVDEQRINIGTLKALGYSKWNIAKKFIVYALFASLIGAVIGLIGGFVFIPTVIYNAYNILYIMPDMEYVIQIPFALIVILVSVGITTLVTYAACRIEVIESPAILMRPKAPKEGKRILLERIPFIWNRFNFTGKVTIRNIFRYKKRFLMTVIGIAGSTALLLSGFGIKDSISAVVANQYDTVEKYKLSVNLNNNISNEDRINIEDKIRNNSNVTDYLYVKKENCDVINDDITKGATLIVPKDESKFDEFIHLQNRLTKENLELYKDGAILSEKIAKVLNVKVGDEITLKNSNDISKKVKVASISENYINHYIYMDCSYYEQVFGRTTISNDILINLNTTDENIVENISGSLIGENGIAGVANNTVSKESFEDTIESLDFVVLIMILCAGALSFVVLYNLTNVNISERIREIATIKVLGFYDKEVASYIFRENILLTIVGLICGLGLGILFHRFIIVNVEMDFVMFGRNVAGMSFIFASLLTIGFSLLVNWAMYYKLKNVKMVESLKSVD